MREKTFAIKRMLLTVLLPVFLSSTSFADGVLSVPERFQEQSQWCWAGASQAIFEYYGTILTQTQIAQYGTNGYNTWNYLYGFDNEPPYYRKGINMILNNWGLTCTYGPYAMSLVAVRNQIDSGRPFVIRWGWYAGGGHFVDGRGVVGNYVYYMDPWPGEGYNIALYSWVVDDGVHEWTHSLELTTTPPIGTRRGDANADMIVEMADAIFTLQALYVPGAEQPSCMDAADSDDNGAIEMGDAIYTLKYLYVPGSPEPPAPGPDSCGVDPTEDNLGCEYHPCMDTK